MTTWETLFAPVIAQGREIRAGQAALGQAVIDAIESKSTLLGEAGTGTGKSFATLIPLIHYARQHKAQNKTFKGVVSTETITLMTQLCEKDLPFLATLYPGFTYKKLMGRSNYLCLDRAKENSRTDQKLSTIYTKLEIRVGNLGDNNHFDGELASTEKLLGYSISRDDWAELVGSSNFCAENACNPKRCFSTKARGVAQASDIVVTNHALIATDVEMKVGNPLMDGILGPIDVLVVDEGHKLEPVLVDQWTKTLNDWELREKSASVTNGIQYARSVTSNASIADKAGTALEGLDAALGIILKFFVKLAEKSGDEWKGSSQALSEKTLSTNDSPALLALMEQYEGRLPILLTEAQDALEKAHAYLINALQLAEEQQSKGVKRKIRKGVTASHDLIETVKLIIDAIQTKDGIVKQYGTYGCIVDGWQRFNGEPGMTLRLVPLDVSARAKSIWEFCKTGIVLSATLTDLTDGTFRYARECIALPPGKEIKVHSPFDLEKQQLLYVTSAQDDLVDVKGAQFSWDELMRLLTVSRGRALVLFTSRRELDWAAEKARQAHAAGQLPYTILVQEKDCDKAKLAKDFKEDTHSILFATKSFFTGFDAPGETLSLVVICKFPLPRYSVECKQQITHWRSKGFPQWYTRAALTDLEQAFGRLVRSSDCRGVLALLDHRAMDTKSNVFKTAHLGLTSVGSPITQDINAVSAFLN